MRYHPNLTDKLDTHRKHHLLIGGTTLALPFFFPSISSVKSNLNPLEYLRVLAAAKQSAFLISAYDIHNSIPNERQKIIALLRKLKNDNAIVLLDSGNYERFWKNDNSWGSKKFTHILDKDLSTIAFSFDGHNPRRTAKTIIDAIEAEVLRDQRHSKNGTVIPIIHGATEMLPYLIVGVAQRLNPIMLAVPERELGEGVITRAATVAKIRKALNKTGYYYPLHLLGTGNPLSILIFSLCGADSFDGLEWCQTCVDHKSGLLYHFQQKEFLGEQSVYCRMKNFPYTQGTLAHNLAFYQSWMTVLHNAIRLGHGSRLARKYLSKPAVSSLNKTVPEAFL